jgi:alcohol dehydrogenase class IV
MANLFFIPQQIITGENAVQMSVEFIRPFGRKAMIVTDNAMVKLDNVSKMTNELDKIGIGYEIYPEINCEPAHSLIDRGSVIYKDAGCDFLIAIGGGSPIDAMKAIGAVVSNGGSITEYIGKKIEKNLPPLVAVPTTAGTGSEATKVSIITNTDTGVKMLLNDAKLMANLAVIDPIFTLTAPPEVTAATGIDALTHAIEAYTSLKAFSMSDLYAVSAVTRIFENLYEVYSNGSNIQARREMATAALEAGIAFSNASVTIVHGMSRPIGALFHVPHGQSNAMLLNICLKYLKPGAVTRLSNLAKAIGVHRHGMTPEESADAFVTATIALLRTLNIKTIQECGVSENDYFEYIPKMAEDALASGSPGNTRRTPNKDEVVALYKELWLEGLEKRVGVSSDCC